MAQSPDPLRNPDNDREITHDELEGGGGVGDSSTSRLGLSSWTIALVAVAFVALLLYLMLTW